MRVPKAQSDRQVQITLNRLAIAINIADNVIGKQWLFDWHQNKLQLLP